jgi:hypothetical protein
MRQGASGLAITAGVLGVLMLLFGGLFFHANSEVTRLRDELQGLSAEQIRDNYDNGLQPPVC